MLTEITSTQNDLVKFCVKLQNSKFRKEQKLILLDGNKTIEDIVKSGIEFEYIFLKKDNSLVNKIKAKNTDPTIIYDFCLPIISSEIHIYYTLLY